MRMCQTLVGFLHCLKVKDTSKPPSRNGETSDSSESDSEASLVSSEQGKEIKETTHLFQEWWRSRREERKSAPSASPYASLFPTAVDRPIWAGNIVGSPFLCLCSMMMTRLLPLVVSLILHNYFPSRDSKMTT